MRAPQARKRLFFALWPDAAQRRQLTERLRPLLPQIPGKAVPPANYHITLVFIGGFAESRIAELRRRAGAIAFEPFELVLDHFEYWKKPRIVCLAASQVPPALADLVANLNAALSPLGFVPEERRYRPHLTLVRKAPAHPAAGLDTAITMHWKNFELVESISAEAGVRYQPLR